MKGRDPNEHNEAWDLDRPLLNLPGGDVITLREAVAGGFLLTGKPGSGKSSSGCRLIVESMIRIGAGIVHFAAKPQDSSHLIQSARAGNREGDVIVVDGKSGHAMDAFAYEALMGGNNLEGLVALPTKLMEMSKRGESAQGESYWVDGQQKFLRNSATVLKGAGQPVTLAGMHAVLASAPRSPRERDDPLWRKSSECHRILLEGIDRRPLMTNSERRDFDMAGRFFMADEFPKYGEDSKTLISLLSGISSTTDLFCRGSVGDLWGGGLGTSFVPELVESGAIITHALDPKSAGEEVGRVSGTVLKTQMMRALERRGEGDGTPRRPILVVIDECQNLLSESEKDFIATARSAGVVVLLATQNIPSLQASLGGSESAKVSVSNLIGLVGTHLCFSQTCTETQNFYAELIGKESQYRGSFSGTSTEQGNRDTAGGSETIDFSVQPHQFAGGRCGGPENDFICDAFVYSSGRIFNSTGKRYCRVGISQERSVT